MDVKTYSTALRELAKESLNKAAESFGFMIRQKLEVKDITLSDNGKGEDFFSVSSETPYLLTTEVIGDMNGKSYLLFSHENAEQVFKICTGVGVNESSMGIDLILKEIDNIVSAASISVLADKLKNRIYGDVPHFFEFSKKEVEKMINSDFEKFMSQRDQVLIQCKLEAPDIDLSVDFIWILSGDILNRISDDQK